MTIPGRGGRPRKWRSDADRVRAYRARQRGEPEPPLLSLALNEGDELAAAWEKVRRLGQELDEHRHAERSRQQAVRAAHRELEAQDARYGWLADENRALRSKVAEAEVQGREMAKRVAELEADNVALRFLLEAGRPTDPSGADPRRPSDQVRRNRAQRRRESRKGRRHS